MSDIPDALVEKALAAWNQQQILRTGNREDHMRATLAAVLPDLPAARPVVDRPDAARVLYEHPMSHRYQCLGCKMPLPPGGPSIAEHQVAMLVAAGVVQDAADVRRAVAEDIAATINDRQLGAPPSWQHGLQEAARIARQAAQP